MAIRVTFAASCVLMSTAYLKHLDGHVEKFNARGFNNLRGTDPAEEIG